MNLGWIFVATALIVAAIVGALALRRPILFRMAARNALRRPKQTATVIAGLMIGTAIISAALVAGQSATSAIRGAVYDALLEVDETVRMEGFYFFPERVEDAFLDDPEVVDYFDAVSTNIFWDITTESPRTDLFEPGVTWVGYDPGPDRDFGDFELAGGGRSDGTGLVADEVIVNQELAQALDLETGDTLRAAYTLPVDPLIPTFEIFTGTLGPGLEPNLPLPVPVPVNLLGTANQAFTVPDGATAATFILACGDPSAATSCPPGTTLRLNAIDPTGDIYTVRHADPIGRCPTDPTCPQDILWLNVTAPGGETLNGGRWTLEVRGEISLQTNYGLVAVAVEPVYDLQQLRERAEALEDLAGMPGLEAFGEADLFGERQDVDLRVAAISNGGRGNLFDLGPTVWMPLEPMQQLLQRQGEVNYVKFSNPGGIAAGAAGTEEAVQILEARLAAIQASEPDNAAIQFLTIKTLKQDFIQVADQAGELMTGLMIFAGSLSIITGLLLIINIFTMLAEERRSELGMARAVGLSRRDVVRLFLFEGSLYAVAAAAIGALLGVLLALGMIWGLNTVIAGQGGDFPPIPFAPQPSAVPIAFATGALLTFTTIFFASRRQSRLNIVRAIRQIDEPQQGGAPWMPWVGAPLLAAGIAMTATGWWFGQFSLQVFGPLLIAAGVMLLLRPYLRRKPVDMTMAALLASYYVATIYAITKYDNIEEVNVVGPLRAVILTLCIVVLASYWQTGPRLVGRLMARFKRLRAIALPAMAYPQHKRFRTGMTLGMFAIVILSIGFFSIFGSLFEVDAARHTGGFEVEATTTLSVEDLADYDQGLIDAGDIRHVERLTDYATFLPDFITVEGEQTGQFGPPQHHVYGIDESFLDVHEFQLLWTLDDISQEEAYARIFTDPQAVIVAYPYSTDESNNDLSHEVGETLTLHIGDCLDPVTEPIAQDAADACPTYTIVGIQEQFHFPGIFLPKQAVDDMFPQHRDLYLYDLAPGVDAQDMAKDLERNYRDVGMNAAASQVLVEEQQEAFRQILGAMKVFLGLGLIVGVLSLGIITSRSVLERRQEIGMMRALGFTGRMIRRIFFIEVTAIILLGALIGIAASIVVTYGLWFAIIRELNYPYTIPWADIGWLLLISYAVALLATVAPILRAAKIPPAEALRYIE
ncbi:MAG: FtsX-like permease family protein [Thermoplasmatota archaeon]